MRDDEAALTAEIIRLASEYGHYGYRRVTAFSDMRDGQSTPSELNVYGAKRARNFRSAIRNTSIPIKMTVPSQDCGHNNRTIYHPRYLFRNCLPRSGSVDFDHDKLSSGQPYKMLTVLVEYTRQALWVEKTNLTANNSIWPHRGEPRINKEALTI